MDELSIVPPDATCRRSLRRRLLTWYDAHARDLPWRRRAGDPYAVWLSEIMLQQTQVGTVKAYFERFLRRCPRSSRSPGPTSTTVLRLWEGLGYYRRARQLHRAAKIIVAEHGGQFPRDPQSRSPPAGHRPLHGRGHPLDRLRRPRADPRSQHPAAVEPAAGLRRRSAIDRRAAAALGDGRDRVAAARRRAIQPGADGTGQRSLHGPIAALRGMSAGPALPCESARAAARNSAAEGQSGPSRRSARRPWWFVGAAAFAVALARGPPLGGLVGLSPVSHRCRTPSCLSWGTDRKRSRI